jgi:predicted hydrocarbon binding protein
MASDCRFCGEKKARHEPIRHGVGGLIAESISRIFDESPNCRNGGFQV